MGNRDEQIRKMKLESMRRMRKERRHAGYSEVSLWVPKEFTQKVKDYATDLRDMVSRKFPRTRDEQ